MRPTVRFWLLLALAGACMAITAALGFWQWDRAQQKLALQEAVERRRAQPVLEAGALRLAADPRALVHRQVLLRGRWSAVHTIYLDNRQMNGRQGFYVVTPLLLAGEGGPSSAVLVQRGWAPRDFQQRDRLPPVETPAGEVEVRGVLSPPPARLYEMGAGERGAIRQNLDLAQFQAETGLALPPVSVQQAGALSEGLLREWPQPASGADRHVGYAFQWWALSALIAILYVWFQFLAPRRRAT